MESISNSPPPLPVRQRSAPAAELPVIDIAGRSDSCNDLNVVVLGDQGGYGYRLCRWLRALGARAELIRFQGKDRGERDLPENVDRSLAGNYPEWIRVWEAEDPRLGALRLEFDAGISVGPSGMKAVTRVGALPVVHLVTGSDLFDRPMRYRPAESRLGSVVERIVHKTIASQTQRANRSEAIHARRAFRKVRSILCDFLPAVRATEAIGELDKLRVWPYPEDVAGNRARVDPELKRELDGRYSNVRRVYLWLSRLNFSDPTSPAYKGAENFLGAYRRLVESGRSVKAVIGSHGDDCELARQTIEQWGLNDHVDWVPHLPYWKLLTYLSIDNAVVCDQICGMNCITALVREALSLGAQIVAGVDQSLMRLSYGAEIPVFRATTEEECFAGMLAYYSLSPEEFAARQQQVVNWACRRLDYPAVIPPLATILREAAYFSRILSSPQNSEVKIRADGAANAKADPSWPRSSGAPV